MINTDALLGRMDAFLKSEEGQRSLKEYAAEINAKRDRLDVTLLRIHNKCEGRLYDLIGKVVDKYQSDKYRERYRARYVEPYDTLLWLLYEYAQVYGEELDPKNIALVDRLSMFTSEAYTVEGWLVERLDGQGSFIAASKI